MKFLHTADLHIGKKLFEYSLLEEQRHVLKQIYEIALENQVDAVLIAGDVYDRAVPPTEAVELLDDFLTELIKAGIRVIMISGNHDSPRRVAFADRILEKQELYIAGGYNGELKTVTLEDEEGYVTFVCMPFIKPAEAGCATQAQAVEELLSKQPMVLSLNSRYVLLAHCFVAGEKGEDPIFSDSETDMNVGGLDAVPVSLFSAFSYVALGHLHKSQRVGGGNVYYAGSPLKYSFGEARGNKSVNLVELAGGRVIVNAIPLKPIHEMRCIKGRLEDLINNKVLELSQAEREDYLQVTLTDREELIDPIGTLRGFYPNVLQLLLEKNKREAASEYESRLRGVRKSTKELFGEFYELLMGETLEDRQLAVVEKAAREAGEEARQ